MRSVDCLLKGDCTQNDAEYPVSVVHDVMKEINGDEWSRMFMGMLLYRLGGEQTFTSQEIDEIKRTVAGVQVGVTEDDKIILRVRGLDKTLEALDNGDAV